MSVIGRDNFLRFNGYRTCFWVVGILYCICTVKRLLRGSEMTLIIGTCVVVVIGIFTIAKILDDMKYL